jgi:hypothetical protein
LVRPDPFLALAVKIQVARAADLNGRLDHCRMERMYPGHIADIQQTTLSV